MKPKTTPIHLSQKSYNDMSMRIARLETALERQTDTCSFLLNRITLKDDWYEKLKNELAEDREVLNGRI